MQNGVIALKRNGRIAEALARFMQGRYGLDQLSRFLSIFSAVVLILSLFVRGAAGGKLGTLFFCLAFAALVWSYIRIFSRNFLQRQKENDRYLILSGKCRSWFQLQRDCFQQRGEYSFFRCPGCHEMVRVPKGKGRIRITCRRCGYSFEKKT